MLRDAANLIAYRSREGEAHIEVISVTCKILFPDNDRVISGSIRNPLGIDGGIFTKGLSELKLIRRVCSLVVRILHRVPTTESVTEADRCQEWKSGDFPCLHKLRSVVGSVLTILVKHQPLAVRGESGKDDIACQIHIRVLRNRIRKFNGCVCRGNIGCSLYYVPTFKVLFRTCRRIGLEHRIGRFRHCRGEEHVVGSNTDTVLVKVGHHKGVIQQSMEEYLVAIVDAAAKDGAHAVAHAGNGKGMLFILNSIGVILSCHVPTTEIEVGIGACARVEENLVELGIVVASIHIVSFHENGLGRTVGLFEDNLQTGVTAGLGHDID